MPKHL